MGKTMGKTNDLCPLQAECEKKCTYVGRELECPYYYNNARPGAEIDDQEKLRRARWREAEEAELAAMSGYKPEPGERTIETVTGEILDLKRTAGEAILDIGARLIEAKGMLSHGEWLPWLTEQVEFSERTAQNFMRLAREWSNPQTLADLGASKALALLALPAEERERFLTETHEVDGKEKPVIDMSARQLEQAIKERDEARKAAEAARADAAAAEQARAKMEADMKLVNATLESARAEKEQADREAARLEQELTELKNRPVDVAVETVVDQESIEQGRAEAMAEMQAKLDKAKEAKAKADEKRKAAEAALEQAQVQLKDSEQARKNAVLTSDEDIAMFKAFFQQTQENANKMRGILLKLRGRTDHTAAQGAEKALRALAEAIGRCAE
ncbi:MULTISPECIES: DUF3102 domain-containing protein [Intestinimonas]|uniref:DUF3102 domain-containing protein n=2 Tax=Eubacteriales incertae sedis TaxID=538999 RepID=UPI00067EE8EE|nr:MULTISPECIES: DUF3102 domain-containing protein [Intestinimonas]MDY5338127.1 DUF3102 domain-containing protein [Intestinimonas sp.]